MCRPLVLGGGGELCGTGHHCHWWGGTWRSLVSILTDRTQILKEDQMFDIFVDTSKGINSSERAYKIDRIQFRVDNNT